MPTIEDIILRNDGRGMRHLRPRLPESYVTEAAELILEHPGRILITTGFYILSADAPETDGPPGAVAIGNALTQLGYEVAYITDHHSTAALRAIAAADHEVLEFPITSDVDSVGFANDLIAERQPDSILSIERCGPSADGVCRNMRGADITQFNAQIDRLFNQHPVSVGIGDGGNEIGMGNLKEVIAVTEGLPDLPCVTGSTKLLTAAVSNWGGYGLVTALSQISGRNMLPTNEQERDWIATLVDLGVVDGFSGEVKPYVDGFTLDENAACLASLHELLGDTARA
jgi:hypothetical protein